MPEKKTQASAPVADKVYERVAYEGQEEHKPKRRGPQKVHILYDPNALENKNDRPIVKATRNLENAVHELQSGMRLQTIEIT